MSCFLPAVCGLTKLYTTYACDRTVRWESEFSSPSTAHLGDSQRQSRYILMSLTPCHKSIYSVGELEGRAQSVEAMDFFLDTDWGARVCVHRDRPANISRLIMCLLACERFLGKEPQQACTHPIPICLHLAIHKEECRHTAFPDRHIRMVHKTHSETSTYGQSHRAVYTEGQHSHRDQPISLLTLEISLREQETHTAGS